METWKENVIVVQMSGETEKVCTKQINAKG
jgi:hypothetical protein